MKFAGLKTIVIVALFFQVFSAYGQFQTQFFQAHSCVGTPWGNLASGESRNAFTLGAPTPPANCAASSETRVCQHGVLSGSATILDCNDGCGSQTLNNCVLVTRAHGGVSGSCASGSSGSCSYSCNDGSWNGSSSCALSCTGTPWGTLVSGDARTAYATATPLPPATCASGAQTRTCTNGVLSGSATVTSCSNGCTGTPWGNLASGESRTAYTTSAPVPSATCASSAQTRTCNNGVLSGSATATSCNNGCAAGSASNCNFGARAHGGASGSCASGYSGSCSYRCTNGSNSVVSNSCVKNTVWVYRGLLSSNTLPGCPAEAASGGSCYPAGAQCRRSTSGGSCAGNTCIKDYRCE